MLRSLLIVDDFYADPVRIRTAALGLAYPEVQGRRTFPGRNSAGPLLPPGLDQIVSHLVGEPLQGDPRPILAHGRFRVTLAGEQSRYHVHCDPNDVTWVGVLYLTLPEHCQGGTAFYRHKALGTDHTPRVQAELDRLGVATIAELLARDGPNEDAWELVMTVPMRFNRLILYRPWLWHSACPGFGDRPENARLIQLVSFRAVPQQRAA